MKNIVLFICVTLFSASCVSVKMGKSPEPNPKAFVKFKDGKTVDVENAREEKHKIIADRKTYPAKNVTFYSDGDYVYANTPKAIFTRLVYTGDINVYRFQTSYTSYSVGGGVGTQHTHSISVDYLQKSGTNEVCYMNYKNVKNLLPTNDPGYGKLQLYKTNRTISRAMFYGGLAGFFTGIFIVSNNYSVNGTGPG